MFYKVTITTIRCGDNFCWYCALKQLSFKLSCRLTPSCIEKMKMKVMPTSELALKDHESRSNTSEDEFSVFCQQTSLHGWQYMQSERGWCQKIFWGLVVLLSLSLGFGFTYNNIIQYQNSGTVTSITSTTASLKDVTFPDIVLCNINQIPTSFLTSINASTSDINTFDNYFIKGYGNPANVKRKVDPFLIQMKQVHQWNESINFYSLVRQKCNDMILFAHWGSKQINLDYDVFYPTITDFGACCVISTHIHFRRNLTDPSGEDWLSIPKGHNTATLEFVLDAETFDYAYNALPSQGFLATINKGTERSWIRKRAFSINTGKYLDAICKVS